MNPVELLAQLRSLAPHVPALASALAELERKPKSIGRARPDMPAVFYAPRIEREPSPVLNKRERNLQAERYRARIDASAEAEGEAVERLESVRSAGVDLLTRYVASTEGEERASRIVRRFSGAGSGDALSTWHYLRALARSVPLDAADNASRGELSLVFKRFAYRRAAAQRAWERIQRMTVAELCAPWRLPGWARNTQENKQTRARRKLHRLWRDILRGVGAAKVKGIPGAAELFAQLSTSRPF